MSLNGLDAPAIAEAAQALQTNASAWFLLKYATRDEVELYARGTGGPSDAASKIRQYEEKSPLYGVIGRDGAKALLKYVPAGTSRLLQARVKVHFEGVGHHFAHDSELSISDADELAGESPGVQQSALTPSPPPPPTQGFASAPQPPLTATDSYRPNAHDTTVNGNGHRTEVGERADPIKEEDGYQGYSSRTAKLLADVRAGRLESHEVLAALKITPTRDSDQASSHSQEFPERKSSLGYGKDTTSALPEVGPSSDLIEKFPSPRLSTGSNTDPFIYKPKVKLGPRPSQVSDTAGPGVATLPAGIISVPVRAAPPPPLPSPKRPTSSQTAHATFRFGDAGVFPLVQAPASVAGGGYADRERPSSRSGSVVTLPAVYTSRDSSKPPRSPKDVPQEKLRLMRALELRRKQQARTRAAQNAASAGSNTKDSGAMNSSTGGDTSARPSHSHSASQATAGSMDTGLSVGQDSQNGLFETNSSDGNASSVNAANAASNTRMQNSSNSEPHALPKASEIPPLDINRVSPTAELPKVVQSSALPDERRVSGAAEVHLPSVPESSELHLGQTDSRQVSPLTQPVAKPGDGEQSGSASRAHDSAPPMHVGQESLPIQSTVRDFATGEKRTISIDSNAIIPEARGLSVSDEGVSLRDKLPSLSHPNTSRKHSQNVSISTSLSGASFLDELEGTKFEEAQPMTLVKSPVTPTVSRPFELVGDLPKPVELAGDSPKPLELFGDIPVPSAVPPTLGAPANHNGSADESPTTAAKVSETSKQMVVEEAESKAAHEMEEPLMSATLTSPTEFSQPMVSDVSESMLSEDEPSVPPSMPEEPPTPLNEKDVALESSSIPSPGLDSQGGSPPIKKHPTINPPHIWGGPLRAASNSSGLPPRHLSPAPEFQRLNRSASIASNTSTARPDSPSGAKKTGVGSRIADRIKALEKSSGAGQASSSSFIASSSVSIKSRKSSFNTPPSSAGVDAIRKGPYPTPSPSPGSNIFTRRFGSFAKGPASESGRTDNTVRPTQLYTGSKLPSISGEASTSNEIQRPTARPTYLRQQSAESRVSGESAKKALDTKMDVKPPSREGALSPVSKRGSFSSQRGETPKLGHSRQSSVESTGTTGDKSKDNKAKKLFKRVTGAFSPRKERTGNASLTNDTIMEGVEQDTLAGMVQPSDASAAAPSGGPSRPQTARQQTKWANNVVIGEVNVQFPDTLLWKRRHMELDGDGYIILLPSAMDRSSRVASKKYHMSEFYPPYVPDQEREELPYSVILDFMDSSTLQCACQNTTDQTNVLHALTTVHSAFAQTTGR